MDILGPGGTEVYKNSITEVFSQTFFFGLQRVLLRIHKASTVLERFKEQIMQTVKDIHFDFASLILLRSHEPYSIQHIF